MYGKCAISSGYLFLYDFCLNVSSASFSVGVLLLGSVSASRGIYLLKLRAVFKALFVCAKVRVVPAGCVWNAVLSMFVVPCSGKAA